PLDRFAAGDDAWPETSTTVIVQADALRPAGPLSLTGPGIETVHRLAVDGLRDGVWGEWSVNRGLFPCGVDLILVAGRQVAALPRTTAVTDGAEG
ncbi:MAG TPA: phosphonate C-P lyase system protein PhnH, partial [Thalassobaculum sp.]